FGFMTGGDFHSDDTSDAWAKYQSDAFARISRALSTGALRSSDARRDPTKVRVALNAAWQLAPSVVAELSRVFGDGAIGAQPDLTLSPLLRDPGKFKFRTPSHAGGAIEIRALSDMVDLSPSSPTAPPPASSWVERSYYSRSLEKSIQPALRDGLPVPLCFHDD